MLGNGKHLKDWRVFFHQSALAAGEITINTINSSTDFRTQESVLAFQVGGAAGDISVNGNFVSTVTPLPVSLAGGTLNVLVVNPGADLILFAPIVPECPRCKHKG